ncbi:retrotransposon protein [Cucumis melo var. makuwa]|uniref:Retrotransposon protein n=1 Tax=Cucumis melo var. makuwa TaxID=1194695 RepID=A0A5D3BAJ5_CUCMM|nr:retrotransposon protein [Cucumis melo var. makuwa]TYJ96870.1 retrotransposon protein [Cucumis melo var. makuwa]
MSISTRALRHVWTKEEEGTLVECLIELLSMGGWKSDNGWVPYPVNTMDTAHFVFDTNTLIQCAHECDMRVRAIAEMRGPACSGFRWNDEEKCIIAKKELFDNWVRSYPAVKGLLNKLFLYYDELSYVFDHDRATSHFVEKFANVGSNEPDSYEGFDMSDGNKEFPLVYSQGIDMSLDDVRTSRSSRALEGRARLSESKRKRGSKREVDVDNVYFVLDQTNDQLRMIAERPARALTNDNHVRTKCFHILREMPKLTSLDRALLQRHLLSRMDDLRGFILMPEDEKEGFYRVLLCDMPR